MASDQRIRFVGGSPRRFFKGRRRGRSLQARTSTRSVRMTVMAAMLGVVIGLATPEIAAASVSSFLGPGQTLTTNQYIDAPNGQFRLWMSPNGNLVLYAGSRVLWSTQTHGNPGAHAVQQVQGNLVVYNRANVAVWTNGAWDFPGATLHVQPDGNLVTYHYNRAIWATGTHQPPPDPSDDDSEGAQTPQAGTSLFPAVFGAAAAVRAAFVLGGARAASGLRAASIAARQHAKFFRLATAKKIKAVRSTAKTVARKGPKWLKAHWWSLPSEARVCLATAAFMQPYKMLSDWLITVEEWSLYTAFGPRLIPSAEALQMTFPMEFVGDLDHEVIECAIGMGVASYFGKTRPR